MNDLLQQELVNLAELHRDQLTEDFFIYRDYIETSLANDQWPDDVLFRSLHHPSNYQEEVKMAEAILIEIYLLLCKKDDKYLEVRKQFNNFAKVAVPSIASYIAGTFGIAMGVATGAVSFLSIAVFNVGINVFCRIASSNSSLIAKMSS